MTRTMHIMVNSTAVSTAKAIKAAARPGQLVVLSSRALDELTAECGGFDQGMAYLLSVATMTNRPIGVNFEADAGSKTCFVANSARASLTHSVSIGDRYIRL